ncbi:MAG: helix-turn-helix domain-containing protein [Oscillospiraceae bacterium]|nr:helix-turn-helix domain-containing protein [Oscillospiraceae bacterium]
MTLGEILKDLLADNDMTQKELAENLNIGPSTIGNYISNYREPDYKTLKILADYFGVSIDFLLDHRASPAISHAEDELLRVFRLLPNDQKALYIGQGKLFISHNAKKAKAAESKAADRKRKYKKQDS